MHVLAIGNIYEMMDSQHYSTSELAKVDAMHLSQKSIYWETEFGPPTIAVVGKKPKSITMDSLPQAIKSSLPREILTVSDCFQPTRSLVENIHDWTRLLEALIIGENSVHIVAYWYSPYIPRLATKLRNEGFVVTTEFPVELEQTGPSLIHHLKDKVMFHQWLLGRGFTALRPYTYEAESLQEVANFLETMGPDSVWVLKSADSVGGAGVFKLVSEEKMDEDWLLQRMQPLPGYSSFHEPPFLIEQDVSKGEHVLFPTADFFVGRDGTVDENVYTSIQRIADGRYYTGFETHAGRIPKSDIEQIEFHTQSIARELAKEGFRGWGNLDFATRDGDIFLLEFNPRRSALLDGINVRRLLGGKDIGQVLMEDYLPAEDIIKFNSESCFVLLDAYHGSQWNWLGAILMINSEEQREGLLYQTNLLTTSDRRPVDIERQMPSPNKSNQSFIDITIREMAFHDLDEVQALAQASCVPEEDSPQSHLTGCWTKEQYRFGLHNKGDVSLSVAESNDGAIIGVFAAFKFQSIQRLYPIWTYGETMLSEVLELHEQRPFTYWEDHMVVHPAHRRKGIAANMLKHCLHRGHDTSVESGMGAVLSEPYRNVASEQMLLERGGEFQKFSEGCGRVWSLYGTYE